MNTVDKVLKIAKAEVGYLEKSKTAYKNNPQVIYDKTAGAGFDNYTKYGKELHDIYPQVMDFPAYWCDAFVDWCFYKAYGVSNAKKLIGGNFDDYTVNSCNLYKQKNALDEKPKVGDQVFFTKNGKPSGCHHTGIVSAVDSNFFYTIEGNTSNANGVVENGGGVAEKKYKRTSYKGKVLFGHPKYDSPKNMTLVEVAEAVLRGEYGNNPERRAKLLEEGWNPSIVQAEVNRIYNERKSKIDDLPKYTWDFLMARVGNPYGVAGIMGNIRDESGFKSDNVQNSYEKKLGLNDQTYTAAVDSGTYGRFCDDLVGYGLCQWTSKGRKKALYESRGTASIADPKMQLNFLWKELTTSYKGVLNSLKAATSVRQASDIVLKKFERPHDQGESAQIRRARFGQEYFDRYNK